MEANKEPNPTPFLDELKDYAETRIKLAKYQAIDSGSTIAGSVVAYAVLLLLAVFALLFVSFTLAYFLSEVLHSVWGGFGCVALIYIFLTWIIYAKSSWIEKPVANAIIKKFFKS
jgi:sensor histidine kinase YesM